MSDGPYQRMQQAAWAAFRREPDPDGIRRVPVTGARGLRAPYFCLTDAGDWFLEDVETGRGVPATPPKACPVDWVPPELRETREAEEL